MGDNGCGSTHALPIDRELADLQNLGQVTLQAPDMNLPIGEFLGDPMHGSWRTRVDGHRLEFWTLHAEMGLCVRQNEVVDVS